MIYKVTKDEQEFEVDDTVLLKDQPKNFRQIFSENMDESKLVAFDNATLILLHTGRVLINSINE